MRKTTTFLVISLLAALLLSMTACSPAATTAPSGTTAGSPASETTTEESKASGEITFTVINDGDSATNAFNAIIEKFHEVSDVEVTLEVLPTSNDYENIIKTRFATNDPPDIFYFWSGSNQYTNMKATENFVDMTNEAFVNDLTEAIKTYQTVDGKIYGIPWGTYNALGVFYNKEVFSELNLSLPKNYQEFLDICQQVKDAGLVPIYEAAGAVWPTQVYTLCAFQSSILPSIGGDEGLNKLIVNQLQIKDIPAVKTAFENYYKLAEMGYMNSDLASATYDMQEEAIANGTAAMVIQGDWMLPDVDSKFQAADKLGYFPLPSENDAGIASLYPPKQLFVSKDGDNVEGAMEFARFMTSTDSLNIWYENNHGIPVYKSATASQYAPQSDILGYITSGQGQIQIQLRTAASFVDFDKICQEMILSGDADKAVQLLNDNYIQDGKDKQLEGFVD